MLTNQVGHVAINALLVNGRVYRLIQRLFRELFLFLSN